MSLPSIEILGKIVEDSAFAVGRSLVTYRRLGRPLTKIPSSERNQEILKHLSIGAGLTANSLARITGKHKTIVGKDLAKLWEAGLVRQLAVATDSAVFKLWTTADSRWPTTAQEACRMAVLGAFYALALKEAPDFAWRLDRNSQGQIVGEMTFTGKSGRETWLIDVPRRGETCTGNAQVYIFPTMAEAEATVPNSAYRISDPHLFKGEQTLKTMLFLT